MVLDSLILSIVSIISIIINIYIWIIIINALISFVNPDPYNPIVQILYKLSEPAYRLLYRFPTRIGNIDLAPLIIVLILQFINFFINNLAGYLV